MALTFGDRLGFSVGEFSKLVGCARGTIDKEIREGRLRVIRVGRRVIVARAEADRWLAGEASAT